jgi:hypothetical protein
MGLLAHSKATVSEFFGDFLHHSANLVIRERTIKR